MKLYFRYCEVGFSNCYILGNEGPREAIIIDPGCVDKKTLSFIENNDFELVAVLITHDHESHVRSLRTLKRIYDVDIYAANPSINKLETKLIRDGDHLKIKSFTVDVISLPGHSADSTAFKIKKFLFTGDSLSAGLIGQTSSAYGEIIQITALRSKLLSLPGDFTVLPGHGPPSSLEAERLFNAGIKMYEQKKPRRQPLPSPVLY